MGARIKPEGMKKRKLTLTCKPDTIDFLNKYCNENGVSISQLVDNLADDMRIQSDKAEAKAKREAKKKQQDNDNLPGQMEIKDMGV